MTGPTPGSGPRRTGVPTRGYRRSPLWRLYDELAERLDQAVGWDKLPTPLGLAVLLGLRNTLRQQNLFDTEQLPRTEPPAPPPFDPALLVARSADGSYNDLGTPWMGMAGTRFGRNVPIKDTFRDPEPALLSPNPRVVSRELLTRDAFVPAATINLLVAAWIQFMVKDWFSHGPGDPAHVWEVPVAAADPWAGTRPMTILKTLPDPTRPPDATTPLTFVNTETPWWDSSQVYGGGTAPPDQVRRRSGVDGKLVLGADGRLVLPEDPKVSPAFVPGWWLGLDLMFTLFVREHNAICDALKAAYPRWSDEELYQRARLINAALVAKIHTVEWTPAIISHPTTVAALHANWWGLQGQALHKALGRLSGSELLSGIPGSATDHFGVPYSLTEEFSIVYRMHPLTPDAFVLRSAVDDRVLLERTFREVAGPHALEVTAQVPMGDLFYSFGTAHPGALVLHNYPRSLQEFERPDNGRIMDLAATDILRARELGVPRYNAFRRLVHLEPAPSFEALTDNPEWASQLRRVYQDDIERVDLMVGMFAERKPEGFGFSDTAFRIFILMASRRLNSDRFLSRDFTPEVYSRVGYDWVQTTTMIDVLLRHFPELRPAMYGVTNAFHPWPGARREAVAVVD